MWFGVHGGNSGIGDGVMQVEYYKNAFNFTDPTSSMPRCVWMRGGTGVFYNNTFANQTSNPFGNTFQWSDECASTSGTPAVWQQENCSRQYIYPADYPYRQGIGRGSVNGAEGTVPVYVWNNTSPSNLYTWGLDLGDAPFIQSGRDYVDNGTTPKSGYTPLVYPHPLASGGLPATTGLKVAPGI
jgi:hypothetical protein